MSWAAVGLGLSIGSSILGASSSISANKAQKQAIEDQARLSFKTRQEEIYRAKSDQAQVIGENRARIGASNVQYSGSPRAALDATRAKFARDIAWRRQAAKLEREAIMSGAPGSGALGAGIQAAGQIGSAIIGYNR